MKHLILLLSFCCIYFHIISLSAQSQIDEKLVTVSYHVNPSHPKSSDKNPGTVSAPLKRIRKAILLARNKPAKIVVHPGTYRERFRISDRDQLLIIEATVPGKVILSGANVFDDWEQEGELYKNYLPKVLAPGKNPWKKSHNINIGKLVMRRELVVMDGNLIEQVEKKEDLGPGEFYVPEGDSTVWLCPPENQHPNKVSTEMGVRNWIIKVDNAKNLVLRGLTFRHASGHYGFSNAGVELTHVSQVLVDNCTFEQNGWKGLHFYGGGEKITVRNTRANHNGANGMGLSGSYSYVLWEDCETSYNNWRGYRGGFMGWDLGGSKCGNGFSHVTWRRHKAIGNLTSGIWLDWNFSHITLEDCEIRDNLRVGLAVEGSHGPVTLKNCQLEGNGIGLHVHTARHISLEGCNLIDNAVAITTFGDERKLDNKSIGIGNLHMKECTIKATASPELCDRTHRHLSKWMAYSADYGSLFFCVNPRKKFAWQSFLHTYSGSHNTWTGPSDTLFLTNSLKGTNFSGWQQLTGSDQGSTFEKK